MKRKIIRRNKKKITKLFHQAQISSFNLTDYISLIHTLSYHKSGERVRKKSVEILDYDNAKPFLKNRVLVPILYKTRTGKMKRLNNCRMFKSMEDVLKERNK